MTVKVVSAEAMAQIDSRAQSEFAMPSTILMEDAGVKAWALVRARVGEALRPGGRLLFVAGKGNNGGDAFVMARQAAVEHAALLTIVLAAGLPAPGTDPARMLAICDALGIERLEWGSERGLIRERLAESAWIFDGITGTGISGPLAPPLAELVEFINSSSGRTIAIDVPSGIGDGFREGFPAVRAETTLTMGLPKLCLYLPRARAFCGRIQVVHLGFPPTLVEDPGIMGEMLPTRAWQDLAPRIPPDTHKNRRGHLAVFAGSRGTTGAAWLCATAAARSRAGLVTLFTDQDAYPVVAPKLTSVMCRPWHAPGDVEKAGWDPQRYSAVLAGPGWGLSGEKALWLDHLLTLPVKGVLDADALALLGDRVSRDAQDLGGRWVLTPHPGEFSRLTGAARDAVSDDPVGQARSAGRRLNAVMVLKGHSTIVASPEGRFWILDGGNPALATGGSGDVLAGIIAGGIAGGMTPLNAALFGVSLHSHLGRVAAHRRGWFLAEDLVPLISRLLWR
jgi:ADP-dependent NAD(P)H-hydrate dehydratase / NAD(P)H-hydrate epimerase